MTDINRRTAILAIGGIALVGIGGVTGISRAAEPGRVARPQEAGRTIDIDAFEWGFTPSDFTASPGDTIDLINTGTIPHNLAVEGINDDDPTEVAFTGANRDWTIPANLAPGTYTFYCTYPGHREAGMVGTMTLVAVGSATPAATPAATPGTPAATPKSTPRT